MAEEDIEIQIGIEKAKAKLGDLKDELERLKRENGEITIGAAAGAVGQGLSSASGQIGAGVVGAVSDPQGAALAAIAKTAEIATSQFFPQITQLLKDGFAASAVAGRISPIAEQYARLTGQQLPQQVIDRLADQAIGPEVAASRARGLSNSAAGRAAAGSAWSASGVTAWDDLERLYQRFFAASPPSPRGLGGGG